MRINFFSFFSFFSAGFSKILGTTSSTLGGGVYFFSSFSTFCIFLAPILPSKAPTSTVSPSLTEIFSKTPSVGEGTSTLTLSVSSSTTGSSESTFSPTVLSHLETVASVTDSPNAGTTIFSDI